MAALAAMTPEERRQVISALNMAAAAAPVVASSSNTSELGVAAAGGSSASNERTAATAAMPAGPTPLSLPVDVGNAVVAVAEVVTVCDVDKALASDGGEMKLPVEPAPVTPL